MKKLALLLLVLSFAINAQNDYDPCFIILKGTALDFKSNKPIKRKKVNASRNRVLPKSMYEDSYFIDSDKTNGKGEFIIYTIIDRNKPELWISIENYSQTNFIKIQLEDADFEVEVDLGEIYLASFANKINEVKLKNKKRKDLTISEIDALLASDTKYQMTRNELEKFSNVKTYCSYSEKGCKTEFTEYRILSFTKNFANNSILSKGLIENSITIKGTVYADSIPLESASVIIKNSKKGIATNIKGQFKLEAKKGDTLSISSLGYETKELVVDQDEIFKIRLDEGGRLNEVVILGYGTKTKCSFTICGKRRGCGIHYESEIIKEKSKEIQSNLYPNPSANGIFKLNLNEVYDDIDVLITSVSGQIIQNSNFKKFGEQLTIDLSDVSSGIYIISIIADGKRLGAIKAVRG
jgi:hypothetical protein